MLRQIITFFLLLFGIGKIGKEDEQIDPTGIDPTQQDQSENPEHQEENQQNEQPTNMNNQHSKLMVHLDNGHASTTPGKRSPGALIHLGYGNHSAEELSLYEYEYNRIIVDTAVSVAGASPSAGRGRRSRRSPRSLRSPRSGRGRRSRST